MDYLYQDKLKCNVKLLNKDLWDSFYKLNTEMIITKPGRRMFPSMRVQVADLDPHKDYCFLVEMVPVTKCRYRYSAATGWAPAGAEEAHSPNRFYVHPESPAPGAQWMSQAVSFGRLKLTNMSNAPAGHVVMASMHKYQPRIHIIETADLRAIFDYAPKAVVDFAETQFIAVTAYQNDKMTKMKIDHNPFAKGFRETGQSKCKRKRQRMEQAKQEKELTSSSLSSSAYQESLPSTEVESVSSIHEDEIIVDVEDDTDVQPATKRHQLSSPALDVSSDSGLSDCDTSFRASPHPVHYAHQQYHHQQHSYNSFVTAPVFYQYQYPMMYPYSHIAWQPSLYASSSSAPQDLSLAKKIKEEPKETQKFTDFSIRAITGLV